MELTMSSVVQRSEGVVAAPVREELVLMSVESGEYFGTSGVGAWLWERTERPVAVRDLCQGLQQVYEVEPATCDREVLRFLADLREHGMLAVLQDG